MRKKQLLALLMASALSVGMAPTAAFAADAAVEAEEEPPMRSEQRQRKLRPDPARRNDERS